MKMSPAGVVFTALGTACFIFSAVLSARETPKAQKLLEAAEAEKGEELTFAEKTKTAATAYLPAIVSGAIGMASIITGTVCNVKTMTALASSATAATLKTAQLQKALEKEVGEEKAKDIRGVIEDKTKPEKRPAKLSKNLRENGRWYKDQFSGMSIFMTPEQYERGKTEINKKLTEDCIAPLRLLYSVWGKQPNAIDADQYEWRVEELRAAMDGKTPWINITEDEREGYTLIEFQFDPVDRLPWF